MGEKNEADQVKKLDDISRINIDMVDQMFQKNNKKLTTKKLDEKLENIIETDMEIETIMRSAKIEKIVKTEKIAEIIVRIVKIGKITEIKKFQNPKIDFFSILVKKIKNIPLPKKKKKKKKKK